MDAMSESSRKPMDEADLEAWLAETLEMPRDLPRPVLDAQSRLMLSLTDRMRETLAPVQPSPDFVRELGQALAQHASQHEQPLRQQYRRAIWFGVAAAGSMASIAGVAAFVFYQRERRQIRRMVVAHGGR